MAQPAIPGEIDRTLFADPVSQLRNIITTYLYVPLARECVRRIVFLIARNRRTAGTMQTHIFRCEGSQAVDHEAMWMLGQPALVGIFFSVEKLVHQPDCNT